MKPQARIQSTIDVLEKIAGNSRIPMDGTIGDYMRQRRFIGAKDRAAIVDRAYDMTRAQARLGWWLEQCGADDTPRSRMIAYLILVEGAQEKRISDLFDGSKYSPERITPLEQSFIQKTAGKTLESLKFPEDIACECPPLYADKLHAYFDEGFRNEMAAMLEPATLDLRVNIFLAPREKVRDFLEADGVPTVETPYSPWGLRCIKKAYLARTKAFGKGWIEIQDEGSQLIAFLCKARPGMQVLDYCAGAGGKTLALAASMERKGRIVAMDTDEKRLAKGRERYKKAQLADIIEVRPLNESRHKKWLKRQEESFDVALCDVPCTGTGTWRRNPDMRWRTYGPSLEELVGIQAEILDKVVHTLKPGGRLVYATCSLLPEENEDQIAAFLKRHEGFEIVPVDDERLGAPFMRLTPKRHNTDGFFAAILQKKA